MPPLDLNKLEEYEEENKVRFNILKRIQRQDHGVKWRAQKHYSTPGCSDNDYPQIDVAVDSWPSTDLYWLPCESLIDNQMGCTVNPKCGFTFEYPSDLKNHEKNCNNDKKVIGKQVFYGSGETVMDEIVDKGYLSEEFRNFRSSYIATFDIETVQIGENVKTISIAVGSNLDDVHYFERKSSDAEDYQKLVNEFMAYLLELQGLIEVPAEIEEAMEKMDEQIKNLTYGPKRSKIVQMRSYLQKYKQLHTFGFNSSKFDLPVLIGGIVKFASAHDIKPKPLKKGAKYITLEVGDIIFKDVLNYTSPCSLDKYLRQWQAPEAKGIFPHGYFKSIEEIRETVEFPPKSAFFSTLKQSGPADEDYNQAKSLYESKIIEGQWTNFSDYLKWYNCQDVDPLVTAIQNSFGKFFEYFGIDPLTKLSLPSIAFQAMFSLFDKKLPYVASFTKNSIGRTMFRKRVDGGLSTCFHMDIDLMGTESPLNARFAPNGDPHTCVIFVDFNSMYLWSQYQLLPLTPGIHWTKKGQKFHKSHMATQISFKALQWLYMEQESERCKDKDGNRVQMDHAYFHGEKEIFNAKVDGYAFIDGKHVIWEFNGCKWHGCLQCFPDWYDTAKQEDVERQIDWNNKIERLKAHGCIVYVMAEHDFVIDESINTDMPRILKTDTESSLLQAIKDETVFGFVVCSVRTPEHVIERFTDAEFLFPPVITRTVLSEDLVSPFMRERMTEQERKLSKRETLIQTYNADDILLMTPLVKFYLDNEMEISNITEFIQYIPGRGLAPFVEKVVSMRVAATNEKDDAKQLTAKLFGNSGYGKCAEKVEDHKNTSLYPPNHNITKIARRPLYKNHVVIENEEGEAGATEVTLEKKTIEDSKPVHIGVAILQWSKLLFLRYMYFLFKHLEPGSFRTVYADTDSMCLALTKSRDVQNDSEEEVYRALFDPLVRPEMRDSWEATWKDWFCTTTETEDIRKPGKLKCEFLFRHGRFCALSPKTYFAYNKEEEDKKTGYKGICHAEAQKLTLDAYLDCLYGSKTRQIENRGFKLNQNKQLVYYEQLKNGLNNIFCKFRVQDDFITCKPLTRDGKIL